MPNLESMANQQASQPMPNEQEKSPMDSPEMLVNRINSDMMSLRKMVGQRSPQVAKAIDQLIANYQKIILDASKGRMPEANRPQPIMPQGMPRGAKQVL